MASSKKASNYYSGTSEEATETPLTLKRLEPRRKLTKNSQRLVIALVGLPARGKSFVSRKLEAYLKWSGSQAKIFNVGRYRREAYKSLQEKQQQQQTTPAGNSSTSSSSSTNSSGRVTGACDASFFDSHNQEAAQLREYVAKIALEDMLNWLDQDDEEEEDLTEDGDNSAASPGHHHHHRNNSNRQLSAEISRNSSMSMSGNCLGTGGAKLDFNDHGRIAIFDATNSTNKRRQWILEECTSPEKRGNKQTGVVFVESLCDDKELLDENYRYKVANSPDFENMSEQEAMEDLKQRVKKYEEQYETIQDDSISYIKVYNLSSKLLCNHIYGRMAKETVPALMAWHIGTRPVFLCRPGQTISGIFTDGEDYVARDRIDYSDPRFLDLSHRARRKSMRGDKLGPTGEDFRQHLLDFVYDEAHSFLMRRASVHDMAYTGTSISGLAASTFSQDSQDPKHVIKQPRSADDEIEYREPFPLKILTSTMPRAVDTVAWPEYDFPINQLSNLNPLDKGDFAGMELEEIREFNPEWYEKLERDPYLTRFPGGESYRDLIRRLLSVVIDVEQQVIPTLVVSHVSILQCLIAYFRNTPVEKCMSIEVPMHTVVKFTPVRGGGWKESLVPLFDVSSGGKVPPVESVSEMSQSSLNYCEVVPPIWQDGMMGSGFLSKSV